MTVPLQQITAVYEPNPNGSGNIYLFALDMEGNLWQWMRGKWGRMKNPELKKD
jgi:hypothetical protein